MRRSKSQVYIDVLEAFVNNRPMRLTNVTLKAKISYTPLRKITKEMIADKLVEEQHRGDHKLYTATPKAKEALTRLKEVRSFPTLETCASIS